MEEEVGVAGGGVAAPTSVNTAEFCWRQSGWRTVVLVMMRETVRHQREEVAEMLYMVTVGIIFRIIVLYSGPTTSILSKCPSMHC